MKTQGLTTKRSPQNKSPEKPEILVKEATNRVLRLLREQDAIIGHLTDEHIRWLFMFTYTYFNVKNAVMTFDFKSKPKKIFISPNVDGKPISIKDWAKIKLKMKFDKTEKDLPNYIKLEQFSISFVRMPPKSSYILVGE